MNCTYTDEELSNIASVEGITPEALRSALEEYNSLDSYDQQKVSTTTDSTTAGLFNANTVVKVENLDEEVSLISVGTEESVVEYQDGNKEKHPNNSVYITLESGEAYSLGSDEINTVRSSIDTYIDGQTGFEEWGKAILNDPDKVMELANDIDSIDPTVVSSEHKDYLYQALKEVTTPLYEALPVLRVLVNKNFENSKKGNNNSVGSINVETGELNVGISPNQGNKSALEVYVHELLHGGTEFANRQKSAVMVKYKRELENIMDNFLKITTEEDLMQYMPDTENARSEAKETLDYIAKNGLSEFIPHAKTNYPVIKQLEKLQSDNLIDIKDGQPLAYKIIVYISNAFKKLVTDYKRDKVGKNDQEKASYYISKFIYHNNRQLEYKRNNTYRVINNLFDMADEKLVSIGQRVSDKADRIGKLPKVTDSSWKKSLFYGNLALKSFISKKNRKYLEHHLSHFGQKPEGTLATSIREAAPNDEELNTSEELGYKAVEDLDRKRDRTRDTASKSIEESFGRPLEEEELEAIRTIVRSDAVVVKEELYRYTDPHTGEQAMEADINGILEKLESTYGTEITNLYRNQSQLLAEYMHNGKSYITTVKNPLNIAKRIIDPLTRVEEISEETVKDIDRLSSIMAFKLNKKSARDRLFDLINEEPAGNYPENGVVTVLNYLTTVKNKSQELFRNAGEEHLAIKGYMKDMYPSNSDTMPAPASQEEEMKKKGYKLLHHLKPHKLHGRQVEMALYTNAMPITARLEKAAVIYGDEKHRGYSIVNSYQDEFIGNDANMSELSSNLAERDLAKLRREATNEIQRMKQDNFTKKKGNVGLNPAVNLSGKVMDFRYEMLHQDKINLLGADNNPIGRIAATYGDIDYKLESPLHNREVVKFIMDDAEKALSNYSGNQSMFSWKNNMQEYYLIGPNSLDKQAQEYWSLLPRVLREEIKNRVKNSGKAGDSFKGFYVRRDMMYNLMGFRELLVSDSSLVNRLPVEWKRNFAVAEAVWKAVVSLAKSNIILRIPSVLVNNTISNAFLSMVMGISPVKMAKYQIQGVKELQKYLEHEQEVYRLQARVDSGIATEKEKRLKANLENRMENSSVRPLIKAGFFTKIVEEADQRATDNTGNIISDKYHSIMKKAPKLVRNGTSLVLLDSTTKVYQLMNNATQYSDFVARYAMYQHHKEQDKLSEQEILTRVREYFVNYYKPSSRLVDTANKLGAVMFTRYYTRIQRFIAGSFAEHPFRIFAGLMTLNFLLPQAANPWDSSVLGGDALSVFKSPVDHVSTALTPGSYLMATGF